MVYGIGSLDLNAWLGGWLGDTQFKKVIMIAIIALITSTSITCWAVEERVLVSNRFVLHPLTHHVLADTPTAPSQEVTALHCSRSLSSSTAQHEIYQQT